MCQLSLETSVCVKSKWNINVPLGNLMEHLYSTSKGLLRLLRVKMAKKGLLDPVENIRGRGFRLLPELQLTAPPPSKR